MRFLRPGLISAIVLTMAPSAAVALDALPDRCAQAAPSVRTASDMPAIERPISVESLQRAIDLRANGDGAVSMSEAIRTVALHAANSSRNPGEAIAVAQVLRSLWLAGDARAAFEYGRLAERWPGETWRPDAAEAYGAAAIAGDPRAFLALSQLELGVGPTSVDRTERAKRLVGQAKILLAAEIAAGGCDAVGMLATLYFRPVEGKPDAEAAVALLRGVADRGGVVAMQLLARLHLDGEGVSYDPAAALDLLGRAFGRGSGTAGFDLAEQLLAGPLGARDRARAEGILADLERSGASSIDDVLFLRAKDAAGKFGAPPNFEAVRGLLARLAELPGGKARRASAALDGWAGEIDVAGARRDLEATAAQDPATRLRLAELELVANGPTDHGVELMRGAARDGSVRAMERLLELSVVETASAEDGALALGLLAKAAAQASDEAAAVLVDWMAHEALLGRGDPEPWRSSLEMAVARGGVVAAFRLSKAISFGIFEPAHAGEAMELRALAESFAATSPHRMRRLARELARTEPDPAEQWFERCARDGLPSCYVELASLRMERAPGAPDVLASARSLLAAAAAAGDDVALLELSKIVPEQPDGVLLAAIRGNLAAAMKVAGRTGPLDLDETLRWHDRIRRHAQVDVDRLAQVGSAYRSGAVLPRVGPLSSEMLSLAARLGNARAMREVASMRSDQSGGRQSEAVGRLLAKAAQLGDVRAMEILAEGGVVGVRDEAASAYARLAAYHGSMVGLRETLMSTAPGRRLSQEADVELRIVLARAGDWEPLLDLSERWLSLGDEHEAARAAEWAADAADAGASQGLFLMGRLAESGRFRPPSFADASKYYEKAIARGYLPAVLAAADLEGRLTASVRTAPAAMGR